MYQNIFHFSGKLPEKVNFDIWVSLKVRCRDYEETCQARQLSGATWSQREFSPRRRRRCTWFRSWFFLALCCTLFLSEQTWRHPTPLVATVNIYALGNIKSDICRWVSLQKTWLLIRALLLFPLKNPFRPSTAFCVIFLWRTSKASRGNFHFPINLTEGRRGLWRFNLTQYVGSF